MRDGWHVPGEGTTVWPGTDAPVLTSQRDDRADHATIISQDEVQGELVLNPAGAAVVEAIRQAIEAAEE